MNSLNQIKSARKKYSFDILIVTFNSASYIKECIISLRKALPFARINVVDNASSDATKEILLDLEVDSLRFNKKNRMLSLEWNLFSRECSNRYIIFVNPDLIVHNGKFIQKAIDTMDADEGIVAAARIHRTTLGLLMDWQAPVRPWDKETFWRLVESSLWFKKKMVSQQDWRDIKLCYADGCFFIVRRSTILDIGGFSEELPLYFNDTEFSIKILEKGYTILPLWENGDGNLTHFVGRSKKKMQEGNSKITNFLLKIINLSNNIFKRILYISFPTVFIKDKDKFAADKYFRHSMRWISQNIINGYGIRVTANSNLPYPEVTGYYVPTLLSWGQRETVVKCSKWLIKIQNADGSWSDPGGKIPYTFDTGQILKGLISTLPFMPEAEQAVRRGCDWMLAQIEPNGRITTPDKSAWGLPNGKMVSENIHLYALEPLRNAAVIFNEPRYEEAVQRALNFYLALSDLTDFNTLAHFHAYVLEALVDLGHPEVVKKGLAKIERLQRPDGSIPAYPDVKWICSTAIAQYAIVWYKLGNRTAAEKAFQYLCRLQNPSGGFYGSYGRGANYFPDQEISWAVKYFLDAYYWHIRTAFDHKIDIFPETIAGNDGRLLAVLRGLGNIEGLKVLDAGCGKGRFARALLDRYPTAILSGVDISDAMLRCVPSPITTKQGSLLNLPFFDSTFDGVFSVEALEHSVNPEMAIEELCRVVKQGGRVVVIDKNIERQGALQVESWEKWFSRDEVQAWLTRACDDVKSEFISYGDKTTSDGLFIAWYGTKR